MYRDSVDEWYIHINEQENIIDQNNFRTYVHMYDEMNMGIF